jgi:hypothetical protein
MNLKARFLCPLLLLLLGAGCNKDSDKGITFKGISATDENGIPLSAPDRDDWQSDVDWSEKEQALFRDVQGLLCPTLSNVEVRPAFPNPCENVFFFSILPKNDVSLNLRLVDENFTLKRQTDLNATANEPKNIAFDVSDFDSGIYRLYYKIQEGSCEYRGYGDVEVK